MRTKTEMMPTAKRTGRVVSPEKDRELLSYDVVCSLTLVDPNVLRNPQTRIDIELWGRYGPESRMLAATDFRGGRRNHALEPHQPQLGTTLEGTKPDRLWVVADCGRQRIEFKCELDEGPKGTLPIPPLRI